MTLKKKERFISRSKQKKLEKNETFHLLNNNKTIKLNWGLEKGQKRAKLR